ncbi:hypothetical protein D0Z03_001102 [Geotrichum reessii]|nr:hypothetical protein D0Z03_001102 [Galactomyces reessii]
MNVAASKKQGVSNQNAKVTKKAAPASKKKASATVTKNQKKEVEEKKEKEEKQPTADEEFDSTDNESSSDEEDTYLKGFDNEEEQNAEPAEKEGEYDSKTGISKDAATAKKQKDQLDNAKAKVAEVINNSNKNADDASSDNTSNNKKTRGVIYIGRIPHGFYESQMRAYFGQFGDVLNLRLSRNKKTGASKHYAFIEFTDADVARVVSETMDNYLLFGHILKVKLIPTEEVRDDLFVGANRKFTVVDWQSINQQKVNEPKTRQAWNEIQDRAKERRDKAAERLKSLGIDYTYKSSAATATAGTPNKKVVSKKESATPSKVTKSKVTKKKATKKSA